MKLTRHYQYTKYYLIRLSDTPLTSISMWHFYSFSCIFKIISANDVSKYNSGNAMLKVSSTEKNRKQEFLASSNWLQYFQTNICNQKVMFCGFLQFTEQFLVIWLLSTITLVKNCCKCHYRKERQPFSQKTVILRYFNSCWLQRQSESYFQYYSNKEFSQPFPIPSTTFGSL